MYFFEKTFVIFMPNRTQFEIISCLLRTAGKGANVNDMRRGLSNEQWTFYSKELTRNGMIGGGNGTGKRYQTTEKGLHAKKKIESFKEDYNEVFSS